MVIGMVYGLTFVVGLFGNGGVLLAVVQNQRLRSARNIFLCNLIITDLLLCLTGIPVTPWYALSKDWRFGALMCRLMPLSNSCSVFVTSWSLTAIAVDKFVHITDPTKAAVSLRLATLITLAIWTMCSLINIPYLMSYELIDGSYYVDDKTAPCHLRRDPLDLGHPPAALRLCGNATAVRRAHGHHHLLLRVHPEQGPQGHDHPECALAESFHGSTHPRDQPQETRQLHPHINGGHVHRLLVSFDHHQPGEGLPHGARVHP
ncbi:hypothetical protein L596_028266 [Steinernema carpocapsae]|uniref:G-protein coupled receptors family 1 profile domain-containing protein n=1 Tax=Steinernema carpocapsae TaxID=34508 RepID=A0A4U5LY21_STECR|nr:hypothetical protein L596_028266 [Steinernema carpocapsae]